MATTYTRKANGSTRINKDQFFVFLRSYNCLILSNKVLSEYKTVRSSSIDFLGTRNLDIARLEVTVVIHENNTVFLLRWCDTVHVLSHPIHNNFCFVVCDDSIAYDEPRNKSICRIKRWIICNISNWDDTVTTSQLEKTIQTTQEVLWTQHIQNNTLRLA